MAASLQETCRREAGALLRKRHRRARRHFIHTVADISAVLDALMAIMHAQRYGKRDVFAVRLALDEALVNAVKHGNQGDAAKTVSIRYVVSSEGVLVRITDQGEGFEPGDVPDPRLPECRERMTGRGLFLMHSFMTWVRFNPRGNSVTLYKRRDDESHDDVAEKPVDALQP